MIGLKAAILLEYNKPFEIMDVNIDEPQRGEVLIRTEAAGVCHSDHHIMSGKIPVSLPTVLGHESVGYVEEIGEGVSNVNVGDMVASAFIWPCGKCVNCASGRENLCVSGRSITRLSLPDGKPLNTGKGGYAEYVIIPENALMPLPPELRKESSAILGCAVLTAYGAVMNTARVRPGEKVAIFGAGGVGTNIIQLCKISGASQIIVVDIINEKLLTAKEFGADTAINSREKDPVKEIREMTGGKGADVTFEVIGLADTTYSAIESARAGGRAVLVGVTPVGTTAPINAWRVVTSEVQVLGSYGGRPRVDLPRIIEMARKGILNIDGLITKKFKLEQINDAFRALEKGEVVRSLLVPR